MIKTDRPEALNPWIPEKDPLTVAVIGKLGEECSEGSNACHRAIIQGIKASHPVTGKPNREAILEEIADIEASIFLAKEYLASSVELEAIRLRRANKILHLRDWLRKMLAEINQDDVDVDDEMPE
jgi:hypothetical protein